MTKPLSKPLNSSLLREAVYEALKEAKESGSDRDSILIGFSIEQVLGLADNLEDAENAEELLDGLVSEEEPM